jgi:drug/metabolite transporter (DMT)-like permease
MFLGLLTLTILGWGGAAVLVADLSKLNPATKIVFWRPVVAAPLMVVPLLFGATLQPPIELVLWALASGLVVVLAAFLYYRALREGVSSGVVALSSIYPLIALLALVLFWGQIPTILAVAGVILIVSGVIIFHLHGRRIDLRESRRTLLLSLGAALAWGAWTIFDWQALQWGSPWDLLLWTGLISLLMSAFVFLWARGRSISLQPNRRLLLGLIAVTVISEIALAAFYFALSVGDPEIAIAASAAYPLATHWILILMKRESADLWRLLATATIVAGVALIQIA